MNVWDWFAETVPAGAAVSGIGVTAFVGAILTDRLMTKGQHERRVADLIVARDNIIANLKDAQAAAVAELVRHHADLVAVKDAAHAELERSRDYYREARLVEADRANKATDQLAEFIEATKLTNHLLGSLDEVAKDNPT